LRFWQPYEEEANVINLEESNLPRIREYEAGREAGVRVLARINEAKAALSHMLENGYDHWIVAFSGGKDSTSAVVIALETALEHPGDVQRIDVVYADTMIEIPTIHQYALSFLNSLRSLPRLEGLPLYCHVVRPAVDQRFWVLLLGRGYPPPHQKFRWCTRRLKIDPVEHRLKDFIQPNRTVIVTGVRFGESKQRDNRLMQSCRRGGECGQGLWFQYSSRLQAGYLAPLIDWKDCDVWDFLLFIAPDLGYQTSELARIYNGHQTRFGCWMCTVVKQDKAMEKTIAQPEWSHLAPLAEFRKHVWEATRDAETRLLREDGRPGRLRHEMRKTLLERLLTVQKEVGFQLISTEEIQAIRNTWRKEGYHE
jgi:DNA sulfur modification protein DndC